MAATNPSDKDVEEAFRTFPFATDQEYQVGNSSSSRLHHAIPPFEGSLTASILLPPIGGSTRYPSKRCFQCQIRSGEREYVEVISRILFQQVREDTRHFRFAPQPPRVFPIPSCAGFPGLHFLRHPVILFRVLKRCRTTGSSITVEDALDFESSTRLGGNRPTYQQATGEEIHTLTFAELRALIEQGKTDGIPNNKLIPNTLNVSPPHQQILHLSWRHPSFLDPSDRVALRRGWDIG